MSINNRRTKFFFKILFGQLGVAFLVVLMALSVLFYAEGYRFNYRNFKISRTGVLYVSAFPKNATISLNGKVKSHKLPFSENLLPDRYVVLVAKDGYSPWMVYSKVESELVTSYKNVVLFKKNPEISELKDTRTINKLNSPIDELAIKNSHGLSSGSYEIWANDDLVTRFSEPISGAIWYTADNQHVLYQQKNQIRVIEVSGENDTLLVTLSDDSPTKFTLNDKGDELYYIDNGSYKTAAIR